MLAGSVYFPQCSLKKRYGWNCENQNTCTSQVEQGLEREGGRFKKGTRLIEGRDAAAEKGRTGRADATAEIDRRPAIKGTAARAAVAVVI